ALPEIAARNFAIASTQLQPVGVPPSLAAYACQTEVSGVVEAGDLLVGINGVPAEHFGMSRITSIIDSSIDVLVLTFWRVASNHSVVVRYEPKMRLGLSVGEDRTTARTREGRAVSHSHEGSIVEDLMFPSAG